MARLTETAQALESAVMEQPARQKARKHVVVQVKNHVCVAKKKTHAAKLERKNGVVQMEVSAGIIKGNV